MEVRLVLIAHPQAACHPLLQRVPRSVEVLWSRYPGHACELAANSLSPRVYALGGDGTIHQVVNGLMRRSDRPALTILPAGRGNDTARSLRGLQAPRQMDLLRLDFPGAAPVYAVCSVGIGFSAHAVQRAEALRGRLPRRLVYLVSVLASLWSWKNRELRIESRERSLVGPHFNLNLANLRYYGGGMTAAPTADGFDGLLDAVSLNLTRAQVLRLLPRNYSGQFQGVAGVESWRSGSVRVDAPEPVPVQADGELVGRTPFVCTVVKGALQILPLT